MLTDPFHGIHMGVSVENLARKYDASRADQGVFAVEARRSVQPPRPKRAQPSSRNHPRRSRRPQSLRRDQD
jgi:hypothetical protein